MNDPLKNQEDDLLLIRTDLTKDLKDKNTVYKIS